MSFEPQNDFERSLMRAATDPAHRPQFYKDLTQAELLIIQEGGANQNGPVTLEAGSTLHIRNMDWNGKPYIPVFTSIPRLQAAIQSQVGYLAINALELMKITQGSEWLLNPGAEYGKELTRSEIAAIINGSIGKPSQRYVAEKETQVMIGQPARYPKVLVEALTRYFATRKEVKSAYLAHFCNPTVDPKPHTLIGIEVSGNWDDVVGGAGVVARDLETPDPPVDFMQLTGRAGVEDYFRKSCKPFYKRKLFGFI